MSPRCKRKRKSLRKGQFQKNLKTQKFWSQLPSKLKKKKHLLKGSLLNRLQPVTKPQIHSHPLKAMCPQLQAFCHQRKTKLTEKRANVVMVARLTVDKRMGPSLPSTLRS